MNIPNILKSSLALDFHENSKRSYPKSVFGKNCNKIYPNTSVMELVPEEILCRLDTCLSNRVSNREFSEEPLSFSKLSTLINLSAARRNFDAGIEHRMYPSAGGRFPLELYVVSFKSDYLKSGVYHYNVITNMLELMFEGNYSKDVMKICNNQSFVEEASCALIIAANFENTMEKYGERGYRYVLLDAGHLGQNIYLVSTALELGVVAIGGFDDDDLNRLLRLNGSYESSLYVFALGNN